MSDSTDRPTLASTLHARTASSWAYLASPMYCDITSPVTGRWVPATRSNLSLTPGERGPPPPCSPVQLFEANLRYPQLCGPRCWWQPPAECNASRIALRSCVQGKWLVFVGDSQVRNLMRFIARSLGATQRLPESMKPPPSSTEKPPNYYDDWDMESAVDATSVRLSFRFSGGDYGKYERVWRDPHRLETFDLKALTHTHRTAPSAAPSSERDALPVLRDAPGAAASSARRRPDLLVFASSLWSPTCESLRRLASTFVDASRVGAAAAVQWVLLGSYAGSLDKHGWPETKWLCERAAAAKAHAQLGATAVPGSFGRRMSSGGETRHDARHDAGHEPSSEHAAHSKHRHTTTGTAATVATAANDAALPARSQIIDLKPLVASEVHPELFEHCPMIRRELYGLAQGGGIHWGPAMHDAWTQFALHALCASGSAPVVSSL